MNIKSKKFLIPVVIGLLVIAGAFIFLSQQKIKETSSPQAIAEKAVNYINDINNNMLPEGLTASLLDVEEENGLYKIHIKIAEEEYYSYATKDGKLFFPQSIDLEEAPIVETPKTEESEPASENTISSEELTEFIYCLKEANFAIYGANWCGWTKKLTDMLGGFDMVKPIYVECTEEEELCEEKEVRAYPTILINGEGYQGERTFEKIAAATGCEIPSGAESINEESSGSGGCQ